MVDVQSEEGFLRVFMSVVGLFVAFHAQEYKCISLGFDLWYWCASDSSTPRVAFQVVDVLVVAQHARCVVKSMLKLWRFRSCSALTW